VQVKIELKGFQEKAAQKLYSRVLSARRDVREGDSLAIILSSPTGSGKTVTITALMEMIYAGSESRAPDREAVFLWFSDSPELNAQSRHKIQHQSSVFREHQLITVEPPFSQEVFEAGNIYFLNTQKLSAGSSLIKLADGRDYTIWQTIQNTAAAKPDHFYLIIDEAHRGMSENAREREQAQTIVQRFIKGYPEVGLDPVRLIIGMSATPERFSKLIAGTRSIHPYTIDAEEVKNSGLLKEKIVLYYPDEDQPTDWSLLAAAVKRWQEFTQEWAVYCQSQQIDDIVRPVLVIQVQDGSNDNVITRTDLDTVVKVVENVAGRLPDGAWAHAFQEDKTIEAGGQKIHKIEASKIEDDQTVSVVLFKMSLSTGWDCPRAEVMMSFRRAVDHTSIAQLVGRMVRTPLARSIEGQVFLNTVSLYLPHYDEAGLEAVLQRLNNPDPEIGPSVQAEIGNRLVTLHRAADKGDCFDLLGTLPTYSVEYVDKTSEPRRLMRLARRLTMLDSIDQMANRAAKQLIVQTLTAELERLRKDPKFVGHLAENQEIEVREVWIEYGEWKEINDPQPIRLKATTENIDDLFDWCGRTLGEGLHMEFWRALADDENPHRTKLELYGVLNDRAAWDKLELECRRRTQELIKTNEVSIRKKPASIREVYRRLQRNPKDPKAEVLIPYQKIEAHRTDRRWPKHLYVDTDGKFGFDPGSSWEAEVLNEELVRPEVIGWLRNVPRQEWALCVPYRMSKHEPHKALFPDFLIFRCVDGKVMVDIVDPHNTSLADSIPKALGLTAYAERHGKHFGRIEMVVKDKGILRRLDLKKAVVRRRVSAVASKPDLDQVFMELG
jgi:type III restriction enzyme